MCALDDEPAAPGRPRPLSFSRPRLLRLAGLLLLAAAGLVTSPSGGDPPSSPTDLPELFVAEPRHVFGRVRSDTPVSHVFRLENRGKAELLLHRVEKSCGCALPTYDTNTLAPGATLDLKVTLEPKGLPTSHVEKFVRVYSNDPRNDGCLLLTVAAEIVRAAAPNLEIVPPAWEFLSDGDEPLLRREIELRNAGVLPLELGPPTEAENVKLELPGTRRLDPGGRLRVGLTLDLAGAAGPVRRSLFFPSNDPRRPRAEFPIDGYVRGRPVIDVRWDHDAWSFGVIRPGETPSHAFDLYNAGQAAVPIEVVGRLATLEVRGSARAPSLLQPGERGRLELRLDEVLASGVVQAGVILQVGKVNPVLAGFRAIGYAEKAPRPAMPPEGGELAATLAPGEDRVSLDLGVVKPRDLTGVLRLTNAGAVGCRIRQAEFTGGAGPALDLPGLRLPVEFPAGGELPAKFRLDARSASGGAFEKSVYLECAGAPSRHLVVALRGYLDAPRTEGLCVGGPRVEVGVRLRREEVEVSVPVYNGADRELAVAAVVPRAGSDFTVLPTPTLYPRTLKPGEAASLPVRIRMPDRTGFLRGDLQLLPAMATPTHLLLPVEGYVREAPIPPGSARVDLFVSGDELGELRACGCFLHQLGGAARRAAALDAARGEAEAEASAGGAARALLVLGAGDLFGRPEDQPAPAEVLRLKAEFSLRALGLMRYDALVPGETDLELGAAFLAEGARRAGVALVSANLVETGSGRPAFEPTLVLEKAGLRIGLVGVLAAGIPLPAAAQASLAVAEPVGVLKRVLPELKRRCDYVVVVAHAGKIAAGRLAREVAGLADLVVVGHGDLPAAEAPPEEGAPLLGLEDRGRWLQGVRLFRTPEKGLLVHGRAALPLDDSVGESPEVARLLAAFKERLAALPAAPAAAPPPDAVAYLGSEACAACHASQHETWRASRHARAWASLESGADQHDPECVPCHSVGYGRPFGFTRVAETPGLTGVGCEACHGAGGRHARAPREAPLQKAGEESCAACHAPDHSPYFTFGVFWDRVKH
ncbi:MAG: DUF1573 domain-containing protein [Planctomycetes bacterium]|nr:DUF1573 domain-containing protein [Planctomycetota bacterium]